MRKKLSALALSMLFACTTFSCEAAKLTKAQMEDLYTSGNAVSTKPSVAANKSVSTSTAQPKTEQSRRVIRTNLPAKRSTTNNNVGSQAANQPKTELKTSTATTTNAGSQQNSSKPNVVTQQNSTSPKVEVKQVPANSNVSVQQGSAKTNAEIKQAPANSNFGVKKNSTKPNVEVKQAPATKPNAVAQQNQTKTKVEAPKTNTTKQKKVKSGKTKKSKVNSSTNEQKLNSSSWRIKVAQKNLRTLGLSSEASTGKFTNTTKTSVLAFQKKFKLKETGELDNATYTKLNWEAFAKTGIKNIKGSDVVNKAAKYKGVPYVFGGTTPKGFDCSGYVQYVFKQLGATLTRTADTQAEEGIFITKNQLKPGDLVFFTTYQAGASHVGIYAGSGKFWNASSSRGVILYGLNDDYWRTRYYGARRVLVNNGEIK